MPTVIDDEEKQSKEWQSLYRAIEKILQKYGRENAFGKGDYWLLDDNYGTYAQHKLYINNLDLLKTPVVKLLQEALTGCPLWEIIVAIDIPGEEHWPEMGLVVRAHEIIDGLRREYFPPEYRFVTFEGSRPGTKRD